jgi:hypothetical protein
MVCLSLVGPQDCLPVLMSEIDLLIMREINLLITEKHDP